jgi:hypothetical protein
MTSVLIHRFVLMREIILFPGTNIYFPFSDVSLDDWSLSYLEISLIVSL